MSRGAPSSSLPFRVMTYNIRLDTPKDGARRWPFRRAAVAQTILRHRPDVLGLQEVLPRQLGDLRADLPQFAWVGVGREDGWRKGEFNPIFFRRRRFRLTGTNTFWLSRTPDLPGSLSWDAKLHRIVTWARLKDRLTGRVLCFVNTHLEWEGSVARLEQARMLADSLPSIADGDPALLVGDFNCREDSRPYRRLTSGRSPFLFDARCRCLEGHEGPTASTCNDFRSLDAPETRIDYLFVTEQVSVFTHRICDDRPDGFFPSDHLPLVAEVRLD